MHQGGDDHLFAAGYTYGHLLVAAISLTVAFAFAVSALRVAGLRSDLWNAAVNLSMMVVVLAELRLTASPSAGSVIAGRAYVFSQGVMLYLITAGIHAQYADLVLAPDRVRRHRSGVVAYGVGTLGITIVLLAGWLDGGRVHTGHMFGAHATVLTLRWWGGAIVTLYAAAAFLLNGPVLMAPGPRAFERRMLTLLLFVGPAIMAWEVLILVAVSPLVPLAGYFVLFLGLNGALLLVERFRVLTVAGAMLGGYVLERRLGGGGMADVFLGRREGITGPGQTASHAAVKVLRAEYANDPMFERMFLEEARLSARLDHPNIVSLYAAGRQEGELYMAMELVDGASLWQIFGALRESKGRLALDGVIELGVQLCDALEYVHTQADDEGRPLELVHRDVSPHNLLVDRAGQVKLTDFGIARSADRTSHTATGVVKGKASYMAPEQLRGGGYDHRVDLYAAGVILYELATGRRLHEGMSDASMMAAMVHGDPPPLGELDSVPPPIAAVLRRALAPVAEDRVPSAVELRRALLPERHEREGRSALVAAVDRARDWRAHGAAGEVVGDAVGSGPSGATRALRTRRASETPSARR